MFDDNVKIEAFEKNHRINIKIRWFESNSIDSLQKWNAIDNLDDKLMLHEDLI